MLCRQIRLARLVAAYFYNHPEFELLPTSTRKLSDILQDVYIIVLFRAVDDALNRMLVEKINAISKIYVSSTVWEGQSACRIAVSNWQAHPERDMQIIKSTIEEVLSISAQEA